MLRFKKLPLLFLTLLFASGVCVQAQRQPLTDRDKKEILRLILSKHDFGGGDIYFQNDVIPARYLPELRDRPFISITDKEIEAKRKLEHGIGYYSFDKFVRLRDRVRISLFEISYAPSYGSGNETIYTCKKIKGRWKIIKRRQGNVWVAEG